MNGEEWDRVYQAVRGHDPILTLYTHPQVSCSCGDGDSGTFMWHIVRIVRATIEHGA